MASKGENSTKKVFIILLLVVALGIWQTQGVFALYIDPPPGIAGDANGDGVINMADVIKVERIILGLDEATPGADADHKGGITLADIIVIEQKILGIYNDEKVSNLGPL